MATDNWPADFRYVSRRLVADIVQQDEAIRPRTVRSLALQVRGIGLAIVRRDPNFLNLFNLARRATQAVLGSTGTVAGPGLYVRAEVDIFPGSLTVLLGWEDKRHVDIAAMMTKYEDEVVGSVLVGLFGSISNYTWRQPHKNRLAEVPSDVAGLYEILDRTSEPGDPELEGDRVQRETEIIPEDRADTVVRLLSDHFKGFPRERLDILMKIFYRFDNFSFGEQHFDRVLIGAPIWAATALPQRFGATRRHA